MIEYSPTGITAVNYILLPVYLYIIYKIAYFLRDKYYPKGSVFRAYFIPGLTVKIAGAIFIGLVYNYYYVGGDTFNFFYHCRVINSNVISAPDTWVRLITHHADEHNLTDTKALSSMFWYEDTSAYTTSCLGSLIGLFCFTQYLEINVVLASIVFISTWLMFITFAEQYERATKYIAIAILFMPGPIVWGSGLFKDAFCMLFIGLIIYSLYELLEKRNLKLWLIMLFITSVAFLLLIKAYIAICLLPALILKTILMFKKRVKNNPRLRNILFIVIVICSILIYRQTSRLLDYLSTFKSEAVLKTIKNQKDYIMSVTAEEGSTYDLGDFEPTLTGVAKLFIPAINVTLFRPYPWETKSLVQFLNVAESSCVLLLTLYLLFTRNPFEIISDIYYDPNLIMCLFFTVVFGIIVGLSSYNFGALSRYKIPCTPFYMLFIAILLSNKKIKNTTHY